MDAPCADGLAVSRAQFASPAGPAERLDLTDTLEEIDLKPFVEG